MFSDCPYICALKVWAEAFFDCLVIYFQFKVETVLYAVPVFEKFTEKAVEW